MTVQQQRQADLSVYMPSVFVLIWSTGFIVARLRHGARAAEMASSRWRYALSIACSFASGCSLSRGHLAARRRQCAAPVVSSAC